MQQMISDTDTLILVEAFGPMEKYSRGRRGAPAKGVGRATGARVQIPPSPFFSNVRCGKEFSDLVEDSFFYLRERKGILGNRTIYCGYKACKIQGFVAKKNYKNF